MGGGATTSSDFMQRHYATTNSRTTEHEGVFWSPSDQNGTFHAKALSSATALVKAIKEKPEDWATLGFESIHSPDNYSLHKTFPPYRYHQTAKFFLKKLTPTVWDNYKCAAFNCAVTGFAVYQYICHFLVMHGFPFVIGWKFAHIHPDLFGEELVYNKTHDSGTGLPFTPRFAFSKLLLVTCYPHFDWYKNAKMVVDLDSAHRFAQFFKNNADEKKGAASSSTPEEGSTSSQEDNGTLDLEFALFCSAMDPRERNVMLKHYRMAGPHHGVGGISRYPKPECGEYCPDGSVSVWLPFSITDEKLATPYYGERLVSGARDFLDVCHEGITPFIWFGPREYYFTTNEAINLAEEFND
jgi:hypothetical protein